MALIRIYENWNWPYAGALSWMREARENCIATGATSLGIGSHDKPLITLGRHASNDEIRDAPYLARQGVQVYQVDRGGGATYHGPGQIILYPVVDLNLLKISIPDFTDVLEQVMVETLRDFGIESNRLAGEPGVFVKDAKIGSIGLRVSGGVVTHGLSLNVCNTLEHYPHFRVCRKDNARVTTVVKELRSDINLKSIAEKLLRLAQDAVIASEARQSRPSKNELRNRESV